MGGGRGHSGRELVGKEVGILGGGHSAVSGGLCLAQYVLGGRKSCCCHFKV